MLRISLSLSHLNDCSGSALKNTHNVCLKALQLSKSTCAYSLEIWVELGSSFGSCTTTFPTLFPDCKCSTASTQLSSPLQYTWSCFHSQWSMDTQNWISHISMKCTREKTHASSEQNQARTFRRYKHLDIPVLSNRFPLLVTVVCDQNWEGMELDPVFTWRGSLMNTNFLVAQACTSCSLSWYRIYVESNICPIGRIKHLPFLLRPWCTYMNFVGSTATWIWPLIHFWAKSLRCFL